MDPSNCCLFGRLCVFLGLVCSVSAIAIPILKMEPGTRYDENSLGAHVKLEVFLDLHCSDSRRLWPELLKVANWYGSHKLDLIIHQFPLPYHQHAHLAAQGFYMIRDFVNASSAFSYMSSVMDKWYMYSDAATETKTRLDIKSLLVHHAAGVLGDKLTEAQFNSFINFYRNAAAYGWKYAVRRGVAGTPWYFLNGVDLGINNPLKEADLRTLLDPLLT